MASKSQPFPVGSAFGFGVYLHWPYCARICPYCDFNVYAAKDRATDDLFEACLKDLETQARALPEHPPLTSIFFGGGTPSLMRADQIERFINACDALFGLRADCEITLEANPNNVTQARAQEWKQAGINRLSIGLQSLDDQALSFLGRDHNSADALNAADIAYDLFASISLDLIYARPRQTLRDWERELTDTLALNAQHLSLYELTIAPGTAFHKKAERGALTPLPDELQAEMYELTHTLTQAAGLELYEISNHARSARDQSKHNRLYWRSGDWLGIGPGAHGRLTVDNTRITTHAHTKPDAYMKSVRTTGSGLQTRDPLTLEETAQELITMGLRPVDGIETARVEVLRGAPIAPAKLEHLRDGGWLIRSDERLALTASGRLLADRIALELLS